MKAAHQGLRGCGWRKAHAFFLQPCRNKLINGMITARERCLLGELGPFDRLIGPVPGVGCAFRNPSFKQGDLFRLDRFFVLGRRHQLVLIIADDALDDLAIFRIARHDGKIPTKISKGTFLGIHAVVCISILRIGPMTGKALRREDRADVTAEVQRLSLSCLAATDKADTTNARRGCKYKAISPV